MTPKHIFPSRTIHADLRRAGIKSYVLNSRDIVGSAPTQALSNGATLISYKTLPEALVNLTRLLARRERPSYYFVYYSAIDASSHEYGPTSDQVEAEIDQFLVNMERLFMPRAQSSRALLMLTADHGQVEVDPKTTIYLNHALRGFKQFIATNQYGAWLTPAGSPRDYFLHVKPERLEEAQCAIGNLLTGKAMVLQTRELIEQGFFGPQPTGVFMKRVGNLVVLPFKGESVFFHERNKFDNHFYGHHGGLTREEMEIPFLACEM